MATNIKIQGAKELQAAIARSPRTVLNQARNFLSRGLAEYRMGLNNNPWRVGGTGGGIPVSNDPRFPRQHQRQRSGNLRDSHKVKINGLQGIIGPDQVEAPYAKYVHGNKNYPVKVRGKNIRTRPWLDFVKKNKANAIKKLYQQLLKNITSDLAK